MIQELTTMEKSNSISPGPDHAKSGIDTVKCRLKSRFLMLYSRHIIDSNVSNIPYIMYMKHCLHVCINMVSISLVKKRPYCVHIFPSHITGFFNHCSNSLRMQLSQSNGHIITHIFIRRGKLAI